MFCNRTKHRPDSHWSWFACFYASVCQALHLGFSVSFGVLLPELMKEFNESTQNIVWLGSLAIASTFSLSPFGSVLCKTIGCRFTAIAGGLTCAVGLFLTSYSRSLMLMFFTYSVLYGLGASLIYSACFLITAKNFRKFQHLAIGIVSLGGSVGVLFFGPFIQFLIDMVGWRGTYRVISTLFYLACVCGASFSEPLDDEDEIEKSNQDCMEKSDHLKFHLTKQVSAKGVVKSAGSRDISKEKPSNSAIKYNDCKEVGRACVKYVSKTDMRTSNADLKTSTSVTSANEAGIKDVKVENKEETSRLIDLSVLKVPRFTIVTISLTLMCFGHYTPQLHLVKYCLELGISADSASKLFIFVGLSSSIARVVAGRLCDISCINTIYVYQFGVLLVSFLTIALPLIQDYTGILVFAVVYGVGDGIFITTMNSLLMFTVDEKRRAAALGLGCGLLSLGIAGGPPLAGFIADTFDGYMWSFTVAGILMQFAGILPVVLVWLKKKESNNTGGRH